MAIEWVKIEGIKNKDNCVFHMSKDGRFLWTAKPNGTGGWVMDLVSRASSPAWTKDEADSAAKQLDEERTARLREMFPIQNGDTFEYEGRYFVVHDVLHDTVKASPYGGGWQMTFPKNVALKNLKDIPAELIWGFAEIDGLDEKIPCLCNPHDRWNGWAKPVFPLDRDAMCMLISKLFNSSLTFNHSEDTIEFWAPGDSDSNKAYKHAHGWTIDGWCWDFTPGDETNG